MLQERDADFLKRNHWYWLNIEMLDNEYIRKNFCLKRFTDREYAVTHLTQNLKFLIKRTSKNCYKVAFICDYKIEFKNFKKAINVVRFVEDTSRAIEQLLLYKKLGLDFNTSDLTKFSFNLLGLTDLINSISKKFK